MKKLILVISISLLSGCAISLTKPMEDYSGTDSARIRVRNYLPPLTLETYEKSGECFKLVDLRTLTAGVNFIGIKSTYNKKIPGMTPPSLQMQGADALEYVIKANQHMRITSQEYTNRSPSGYISSSFIPEVGHDYDIFPYDSSVIIKDLSSKNGYRNWNDDDKECKYKTSLLGGRNYE
ncbi:MULTISPECIES: hypothetical protein [Photorhabdus]|uniref:Lipoprotein n=2 Tax=Photorhabdus asymbiotica TaxID=291112 RepID=C7BPR8_PHOAA|nr:hypothetical protein [Photorhabdus asymbiotica]RKS56781.1 hypothetical protein BDD30_3408 [Photorhabdus asymbiotica]CAQ84850.1 Hypothetical protein PAU_02760 [Photorhabdus asymbiotica]